MSLLGAHGAVTAQHRAEGRTPLALGPWSRKGRGGREDLCAEPEEKRAG